MYLIWNTKNKINFSFKDKAIWEYAAFSGFFSFAAYASYFIGVGNYSKTIVAALGAAYPIATIFLSYVFCKEKLRKTQFLGIILVILGAILISVQ